MTMRTDIHRPSVFNPENYKVVGYFDLQRPMSVGQFVIAKGDQGWECDPQTDMVTRYVDTVKVVNLWGGKKKELFGDREDFKCDHCGQTNVRWVVAVDYIPTGERLCFGWVCVENRLNIPADKFQMDRLIQQASAYKTRLQDIAKELEFEAKHPSEYSFISNPTNHVDSFIMSLWGSFQTYHTLTEGQLNAIPKFIENKKRFAENKEAREAKLANAPQAPQGRLTVEGSVVSVKSQESQFGIQWKMLVEMENGNRVYVSIPANLMGTELKGVKVRFNATFERKEDHFSYGKRPSNAEVVNA